jgi:4-diphosphocytidyl-2-C-methyl-D-erythritol kinase
MAAMNLKPHTKLRAKAKINLFLHVIGKRPDGYHLLESMVAFTEDIYDVIQVEPATKQELVVSGVFASPLLGGLQNNIVLKAAKILSKERSAKILLEKNLPIASGIGGGSSDAAITVKLLLEKWQIKLTKQQLNAVLLMLGADVPICYHAKAAYFSGIGEIIEEIQNFPPIYAVLVNPLQRVSSQEIFTRRASKFNQMLCSKPFSFVSATELLEFLTLQKNDLQAVTVQLLPEINTIIDILQSQNGCQLARMSGSGATCFGLFLSKKEAIIAENNIVNAHPNWWVKASVLV